ncbi:hypothetical protein [Streptomyces sp. NPDC057552]|uniref:hypothetical protein n=1 Tax=Streptomyces sp. NPDC057552 TaxID=3350537 RepID=UPI0036D1174E
MRDLPGTRQGRGVDRLVPPRRDVMHGDALVSVELLSAQVDIVQPSEIGLYL